jgi:hypothetical protein
MSRITAWLAATVVLMIFLIGYQVTVAGVGGEEERRPSASSKGLTGGKDAVARYLDCLRSHGVPMPSGAPSVAPPSPGAPRPTGPQFPGGSPVKPAGVDDHTWQIAKAACTGIVPGL